MAKRVAVARLDRENARLDPSSATRTNRLKPSSPVFAPGAPGQTIQIRTMLTAVASSAITHARRERVSRPNAMTTRKTPAVALGAPRMTESSVVFDRAMMSATERWLAKPYPRACRSWRYPRKPISRNRGTWGNHRWARTRRNEPRTSRRRRWPGPARIRSGSSGRTAWVTSSPSREKQPGLPAR